GRRCSDGRGFPSTGKENDENACWAWIPPARSQSSFRAMRAAEWNPRVAPVVVIRRCTRGALFVRRELLVQERGPLDPLAPVGDVQALVLRVRVADGVLEADEQRRGAAERLGERTDERDRPARADERHLVLVAARERALGRLERRPLGHAHPAGV